MNGEYSVLEATFIADCCGIGKYGGGGGNVPSS